jgi:hypothetical protein
MTDLEDSWPAQQPPAKFAEQVVAAAMREHRASSRRRYLAAGAAIVVVAAAGVALFVGTRTATSTGEARADKRIEVAIGSRAVAVLEAGAHISWNGDTVVQDVGDVFYRVEPGSRFEVHTPMANAAVLGTCFRISVNDKETNMNRRDVIAGAVGAIAATAVVIGVYEGKVAVSHGKDSVTVSAGETAVADSRGVRPGTPPTKIAARTDDGSAHTAAELRERLGALEKEKAALEQELADAHEAGAKSQYDMTPDDWAKLAEQGAFKYQVPCYREGGFKPSADQIAKLGLAAKDADAIQSAYLNANKRFGLQMQQLCTEANFGSTPDDIGPCIGKMFQAIYGQGPDAARALYSQTDEILAGKRPKPADGSPQSRMLLMFANQMAPFEAELAQTFGADEAHRIAYSDDLCWTANSVR